MSNSSRNYGPHTVYVNGVRVDLIQSREPERLKLLRKEGGITAPMARNPVSSRPVPRRQPGPLGQPKSPRIRGDRLRRALAKAAAESPNFNYELFEDSQKARPTGHVQHRLAKRYRAFTDGEMTRLRESVKRLGVIQPIAFYRGFVLDGWHRLRVAEELGMEEVPTMQYTGRTEDIEAWLAAQNEARRHLSDLQFAVMIAKGPKSQKLTAVNAEHERKKTRVKSDRDLAAEHGIQPNMLSTARRVLASGDDELIEAASSGELGRTEARKRLRELAAARRTEEELALQGSARSDLVVCDVADLLAHVAPESVAAVITDPPWSDMAAWENLARVSAVVLQPGGTLAAMASKERLPEVFDRLRAGAEGTDLEYRWLIGYALPKRGSTVHATKFTSQWHPVIVMSRGRRTSGYAPDTLVAEWLAHSRLRLHHKWEKDIPGFQTLIEWFSDPGELVIDPFIGGGTTGVAALQAGRQFWGCDIDPQCVDTAGRRLNGLEAAA